MCVCGVERILVPLVSVVRILQMKSLSFSRQLCGFYIKLQTRRVSEKKYGRQVDTKAGIPSRVNLRSANPQGFKDKH